MSGKADLVPYFSISRGRLAKSKDVREVLANIRMMRLVISSKSIQSDAVSISIFLPDMRSGTPATHTLILFLSLPLIYTHYI